MEARSSGGACRARAGEATYTARAATRPGRPCARQNRKRAAPVSLSHHVLANASSRERRQRANRRAARIVDARTIRRLAEAHRLARIPISTGRPGCSESHALLRPALQRRIEAALTNSEFKMQNSETCSLLSEFIIHHSSFTA